MINEFNYLSLESLHAMSRYFDFMSGNQRHKILLAIINKEVASITKLTS